MGRYPTTEELADLVHDYFAGRGEQVTYDPEEGIGTFGQVEFSVHNMAANLAKIHREQWPDYVAWHFGRLVDSGPPELPSRYSEVRKRLRVRLASDSWVEQLPFQKIARPVADDLHEVLMLSLDGTAVSVPPESLDAWDEPLDKLWQDARENTLWDEPRERRMAIRPTGERFVWVRGSWWVASLLLDLGRYLSPRNPHGAAAMVPVRDALFFHEITDQGVADSVAGMMELGLQFHLEGPDSISPHVYWWRDGKIRRVVAYENGRIRSAWDRDFKRVLAQLDPTTDRGKLN